MKKIILSILTMSGLFVSAIAQTNADTKTLEMYLIVKNALAADNAKDAAIAAKQLTEHISGKANSDVKVLKPVQTIAKTEDISTQRREFVRLSNELIDNLKDYKGGKSIYIDYCPMKKAFWISEFKKIKNPYYGSSMLTCGKVTETKN